MEAKLFIKEYYYGYYLKIKEMVLHINFKTMFTKIIAGYFFYNYGSSEINLSANLFVEVSEGF